MFVSLLVFCRPQSEASFKGVLADTHNLRPLGFLETPILRRRNASRNIIHGCKVVLGRRFFLLFAPAGLGPQLWVALDEALVQVEFAEVRSAEGAARVALDRQPGDRPDVQPELGAPLPADARDLVVADRGEDRDPLAPQIGRASCRERVLPTV